MTGQPSHVGGRPILPPNRLRALDEKWGLGCPPETAGVSVAQRPEPATPAALGSLQRRTLPLPPRRQRAR